MRQTVELTPRGKICLVLLHLAAGAAWLTGDDNARLAASMLAAPILIDLFVKRFRAPRLELHVAPRRTHARTSFVETVVLENKSPRRAIHGLSVLEPRTQTVAGGSYVPTLPPGARQQVQLGARSRRRSVIHERTFVVDTLHPLGMLRWRAVFVRPAQLVVEPARIALSVDTLRALDAQARESRSGGDPEHLEYFSLRDYRLGDDARHVQPYRSASLGSLVTRVYRGRQDPQCAVVLDLRRAPGAPPSLNSRGFERQLSMTASVVDALLGRGARIHCLVFGPEVVEFRIESGASATEFMTYLAAAHTVPYYAPADDLADRIPDRSSCFWIAAGDYRVTVDPADPRWRLVREVAS